VVKYLLFILILKTLKN